MAITIATWNINSVRLREESVLRLLRDRAPDILCLQECKSPLEDMPRAGFSALGYSLIGRGQKGYNGVAILSRLPMSDAGSRDFVGKGDARHVAGQLENGLRIHNFYIPSGGNIADAVKNEKFDHKLRFVEEMRDWFLAEPVSKSIILGDFNIAPAPADVYDHKKMMKIISHTPAEVERLMAMKDSGPWVDAVAPYLPDAGRGRYSWWTYRVPLWNPEDLTRDRGRRLDHIWVSADLADAVQDAGIVRDTRSWQQPSDHVPVFLTIDV